MDVTPFPAWSWSVEQCLKEYKVKLDKGLSSYDVEKRRERYGWNELKKEKGKPLWRLVLEQFDNMLVKILLMAACISFTLAYLHGNENGESLMPLWEFGKRVMLRRHLKALKEVQCDSSKVVRDGYLVLDLPARELVPGDIVELWVGDKARLTAFYMQLVALAKTCTRMLLTC
ncbi:unnamed protein product [Ilex paraguariensis]|uniref:Cation-transporting P-type ATPase N-terminal domain-containing protein n=1 Tax=Ilex paraguariensis TaxID=185542 RepID=A0ABC8RER6_9AQUA